MLCSRCYKIPIPRLIQSWCKMSSKYLIGAGVHNLSTEELFMWMSRTLSGALYVLPKPLRLHMFIWYYDTCTVIRHVSQRKCSIKWTSEEVLYIIMSYIRVNLLKLNFSIECCWVSILKSNRLFHCAFLKKENITFAAQKKAEFFLNQIIIILWSLKQTVEYSWEKRRRPEHFFKVWVKLIMQCFSNITT